MDERWTEHMAAKVALYRQQRADGGQSITRTDRALAKKYLSHLEHHKDCSLFEFLEDEFKSESRVKRDKKN